MAVKKIEGAGVYGDLPYEFERLETTLELAGFDYGLHIKEACGECPERSLNLSCPPHSPYFPDYVAGCDGGFVVCYRVPADSIPPKPGLSPFRTAFLAGKKLLVAELLERRSESFIVAGSGACDGCKECVVFSGVADCAKPDKRIYSLESMGVNVVELMKECFAIEVGWEGGNTDGAMVSSVGAYFNCGCAG